MPPTGRFTSWLALATMACAACRGTNAAPPREDGGGAPRRSLASARLVLSEAPAAGDVALAVRQAMAAAAAEEHRLVVYVGAVWCEPCRRFHEAAARGDLDAVFGSVTLFEFDLDRDGARLAAAGYSSAYVPLFALPSADGRASGEQVDGAIKGDGAVPFVVARLARLLAR